MNGLIHPFTKALYEQDGSGHVKVALQFGGGRSRHAKKTHAIPVHTSTVTLGNVRRDGFRGPHNLF